MNIIVNFKSYKVGREALKLAEKIEKHLGENAVVCVQDKDVKKISEELALMVFGQRYSDKLRVNGAVGSLLNHSDYRVSLSKIKRTLEESRRSGFEIILCAKDLDEVKKFLKFKDKPIAIAFEFPELIGTGKSITKYKGGEVREFTHLLEGSGVEAYCGAGISDIGDVMEARRLGCSGVLIASAIAGDKVKNPDGFLIKLEGLIKKYENSN